MGGSLILSDPLVNMFSTGRWLFWVRLALVVPLVASVSITDIQGPAFQSPLAGQSVQNVTGIVTAKVRLLHSSGRSVDETH